MKDIHGNPLKAGDTVLVYAQRYKREREAGGVWVVDQTRPLPVADVPMAKGRVVLDEDVLSLIVRYELVLEDLSGKAAAPMGGGEYALEKIERRAA